MDLEILIGNYYKLKSDCDSVRYSVFVIEQNIPEEVEMDDRDKHCIHTLIKLNGQAIGTGRIDLAKQGKIGRVAVVKNYRQKGYGKLIVEELIKVARQERIVSVWLNAQKTSINFYRKLGFQVISEEFSEANIIHQKMSQTIS